jgi:hypothetical protein
MYNTRLNFEKKDSYERAIFFEHLHKVDGDQLFLLCWIGNYHAGSIFHCAWQFPQHLNWPTRHLEYAAYRTYREIAIVLHGDMPAESWDREVRQFVYKGELAVEASGQPDSREETDHHEP